MVSSARVLKQSDTSSTIQEDDLHLQSTKKVKDHTEASVGEKALSYVDKLLTTMGGVTGDDVSMEGVAVNGVMEEVPIMEHQNSVEQNMDGSAIPLSDVELMRWASSWLNTLVVHACS